MLPKHDGLRTFRKVRLTGNPRERVDSPPAGSEPLAWGEPRGHGATVSARAEYAAAKRAGTAATFVTVLRAEPARVALSVLVLLALPFILLRR